MFASWSMLETKSPPCERLVALAQLVKLRMCPPLQNGNLRPGAMMETNGSINPARIPTFLRQPPSSCGRCGSPAILEEGQMFYTAFPNLLITGRLGDEIVRWCCASLMVFRTE